MPLILSKMDTTIITSVWSKYSIREDGVIMNIKTGKIISPCINTSWYSQVWLYQNWVRKYFLVHVLVAQYFIGDKPEWMDVNHKNGIKIDCRKDNLEYITRWKNIQHAYDTWLRTVTCHNNFVKLRWALWWLHNRAKKVVQKSIDGTIIKIFDAISDAHRETKICAQNIGRCCKWNLRSAGWFQWEYIPNNTQ